MKLHESVIDWILQTLHHMVTVLQKLLVYGEATGKNDKAAWKVSVHQKCSNV
jgi:hypothetical protein